MDAIAAFMYGFTRISEAMEARYRHEPEQLPLLAEEEDQP